MLEIILVSVLAIVATIFVVYHIGWRLSSAFAKRALFHVVFIHCLNRLKADGCVSIYGACSTDLMHRSLTIYADPFSPYERFIRPAAKAT